MDPIAPPRSNHNSMIRRLSKKVAHSLHPNSATTCTSNQKTSYEPCFDYVDLMSQTTTDSSNAGLRSTTYRLYADIDKDGSSFSRSRSSSVSSLDTVCKESIQTLVFTEAYSRKSDTSQSPCLWVGTTLGSVLVIPLGLPESDLRSSNPVIVSPSGTIFRLRGSVIHMSFLDCTGIIQIDQDSGSNRDGNVTTASSYTTQQRKAAYTHHNGPGQQSISSLRMSSNSSRMSPTPAFDHSSSCAGISSSTSTATSGVVSALNSSGQNSSSQSDRQLAIFTSEKQARVILLPSQVCAYRVKITDTSQVISADVLTLKDNVCLAAYLANGHFMTFSLPSLRPLLDTNCLPSADLRIIRTFSMSNYGNALYFCSPTEIQKFTFDADVCENLIEMTGQLFLPCEITESPKTSFFRNLFNQVSVNSSVLDREQLFGEAGGKAVKGIASYSGTRGYEQKSSVAMSEIARAKQAAIERGEKLGDTEESTERMKNEAEIYQDNAHKLMAKYRDKKWYQF